MARRRHVSGRGIQEARIRGHRRCAEGAGGAGREDHGDGEGEVLFRRAGDEGEGQIHGQAQRTFGAVVSVVAVGLVLRQRGVVVRDRTTIGIRDSSAGAVCRRSGRGGRSVAGPAGTRPRKRSRHRRRRHRQDRDRHRRGEGIARRHRPPLRPERRGHRRIAPHDHRLGKPSLSHAIHSASTPGPTADITRSAMPSRSAIRAQTLDGKGVDGKGTPNAFQNLIQCKRRAAGKGGRRISISPRMPTGRRPSGSAHRRRASIAFPTS